MGNKHTPGPWINATGNIFESTGDLKLLAKCTFKNDANLIAAAPEMYELVATLALMTTNSIDPEDFAEIRNKCFEVLAKARGE